MSLNENLQNNHIFEGKIRKFEEELIVISIEMGKSRGRSPITTRILTYLLIHGQLTQKQLRELTNYSISTGSISTNLAALESIGFVKKRLIQGTHTNIYSLGIDLGQNISSLAMIGLNYISQAKKFLKAKKSELDKTSEANKPNLMNRFEELDQIMKFYLYLYGTLTDSSKPDFNIKIIDSKGRDAIQNFDEDTKAIEDSIVDFFTTSPLFLGKNELFSGVFAYFITRKTLNQKKLRNLTRLSVGKVSIEINKLLNLGIIEIVDKSDNGQLTYQMKSVVLAFLKITYDVLRGYIKWKNKIEEIKAEMEKEKEEFKLLNGYAEVLKTVDFFLEIMPIYEKMHSIVKKKYEEIKV